MTLATAGVSMAANKNKTVTYHIKGFSCITCAVGLDTMLGRQTGVIQSKSSYPDAITVIEFNPDVVTEKSLKDCIAELGFTAEERPR